MKNCKLDKETLKALVRGKLLPLTMLFMMILLPGITAQKAQTTETDKLPVNAPENIVVLERAKNSFADQLRSERTQSNRVREQQLIEELDPGSPFYSWNLLLSKKLEAGQILTGYSLTYDLKTKMPDFDESKLCEIEILDMLFMDNQTVQTLIIKFNGRTFEVLPKDSKSAQGTNDSESHEIQLSWSSERGIQSLFISYLSHRGSNFEYALNSTEGCIFVNKQDLFNEVEPKDAVDFF